MNSDVKTKFGTSSGYNVKRQILCHTFVSIIAISSVMNTHAMTVTTTADSGPGSLRQAIVDTPTGSTILFAPGLSGQTITLTTGQIMISKNLDIDASSLAGGIVIDGYHNGRIFEYGDGTVNSLTGLTLSNAYSTGIFEEGGAILMGSNTTLTATQVAIVDSSGDFPRGGGIFSSHGNLILNDCVFRDNWGTAGGAVYNHQGEVTVSNTLFAGNGGDSGNAIFNGDGLVVIENCTFENNGSPAQGGSIYNFLGTTMIIGSTITGGNADYGGAIFVEYGSVEVNNCVITNNAVTGFQSVGGAIHCVSGTVSIAVSTIMDNHAAYAGAIGCEGRSGTIMIRESTIANNRAANGGGAVEVFDGGSMFATNCTITGNASHYGGAIFANENSDVTLVHCTLSLNNSTGTDLGYSGGGALDIYLATVRLTACVLAENSAATGNGPDIWMESGSLSAENCLVGDGTNSRLVNGQNGNQVGTGASPIDPLLAPLGDSGGPTETMIPLPGSPASDMGGATGVASDQRGEPRSGSHTDVGSVEGVYLIPCNISMMDNGNTMISFTTFSNLSLGVVAGSDLSLPVRQWSRLGSADEVPSGSGRYQFIDTQAPTSPIRFYGLAAPQRAEAAVADVQRAYPYLTMKMLHGATDSGLKNGAGQSRQ